MKDDPTFPKNPAIAIEQLKNPSTQNETSWSNFWENGENSGQEKVELSIFIKVLS